MSAWRRGLAALALVGHGGLAMAAPCTPQLLGSLGRHLQLSHFSPAILGAEAPPVGAVVSADCRPDPGHPGLTLVAAVHTSDDDNGHWLALGLVDAVTRRVQASLHEPAGEDAALHYETDSLRLDTARYQLAPGVRAFGLDITSGYTPNCGDGGFGAVRTLYVVDGTAIRPVLSNLFMTSWRYIQQAQSRCNLNGPETEMIENFDLSIALGPERHAGYQDLVIRATSSRDDRRPTGRKPFQHTLRYDGHSYPTQAFEQAYGAWRR